MASSLDDDLDLQLEEAEEVPAPPSSQPKLELDFDDSPPPRVPSQASPANSIDVDALDFDAPVPPRPAAPKPPAHDVQSIDTSVIDLGGGPASSDLFELDTSGPSARPRAQNPEDAAFSSLDSGALEVVDLTALPAMASQPAEIRPASLSPVERLQRSQSTAHVVVERGKPVYTALNWVAGIAALVSTCVAGLWSYAGWDGIGRLYDHILGGSAINTASQRGLEVVWMRSQLYPNASGSDILVMSGEAINTGPQPLENWYARGELKSPGGGVLAYDRAPLGARVDALTLARITDGDVLAQVHQDALSSGLDPILPQGRAPFTIVILTPPKALAELRHDVGFEHIAPAAPVQAAEPAAEPVAPESDKGLRRKKKRPPKTLRRRAKP